MLAVQAAYLGVGAGYHIATAVIFRTSGPAAYVLGGPLLSSGGAGAN